jgi:hypothetical protein
MTHDLSDDTSMPRSLSNDIVIRVVHPDGSAAKTYLVAPDQTFVVPGMAREVVSQTTDEETGDAIIRVRVKDFGLPKRASVTFGHLEQFSYGQQERS